MTSRQVAQWVRTTITEQPGVILRYATIALVLAAAAFLVPAAVAGGPLPLVILGLPIVVAALGVLIRWPDLFFPLAVVAALLVPMTIGTGSQTGINASVLLAVLALGLWGLDMVVGRAPAALSASSTVPPLLALAGVSVLATGVGQVSWFIPRPAPLTAQLGGLAIFLLSVGAFLFGAHRLTGTGPLKRMVFLLIGLGGIFALSLLIHPLTQYGYRLFQRAVSDASFWTWLVALAFSQAWLNRELDRRWRIACLLVVLLAFFLTLVIRESWTSGWFPSFVAIATIVVVRKPRWAVRIGAFGLVVILASPDLLGSTFMSGDNPYSLQTRIAAWEVMAQVASRSPILGLGPANYSNYTPLYNILGYSGRFNSHNNYIDIVAQIGLVGLGCFLWFAVAFGRNLWKVRDLVPEGFPRAYAYGVLGGFAGMLVSGMLGDWFLPYVYNVGLEGFRATSLVWLFLGCVVSLERIYLRGAAS